MGKITARSRNWNPAGAERVMKKEEEKQRRIEEKEAWVRKKQEMNEDKARAKVEKERREAEERDGGLKIRGNRERTGLEEGRNRSGVKKEPVKKEFSERNESEIKPEYGWEEDFKGTSAPRIEASSGYRAAPEPANQPSYYQPQHHYAYGASSAYGSGLPDTRVFPAVPPPSRQPLYSDTRHQPQYQSSTASIPRDVQSLKPPTHQPFYHEARPKPSSQCSAYNATSFPHAPPLAPAAMRRRDSGSTSGFLSSRAPRPSPQELASSPAGGPQIGPSAYIPYPGTQNTRGMQSGFNGRAMQNPATMIPPGPAVPHQGLHRPSPPPSRKRPASPSSSRHPSVSRSDRSVKIKRESPSF
ncbi:MAG: hypothetical protein Q9187_004466 [Circinaria calcarea]